MNVSATKKYWDNMIKESYGSEFPKLYRVKFNKSGVIQDKHYHYALRHFPSVCKKFEDQTGVKFSYQLR